MTLESRIEKAAVKLLEKHGFLTVKVGQQGWPDRLVILGRDRHFWLEMKQPGGSLTPAQKRRIPRLQAIQETVVIATSAAEALEAAAKFDAYVNPGLDLTSAENALVKTLVHRKGKK